MVGTYTSRCYWIESQGDLCGFLLDRKQGLAELWSSPYFLDASIRHLLATGYVVNQTCIPFCQNSKKNKLCVAFVLCTNMDRVFKIKQTFKNLLEPLLVYRCIVRSVLHLQWYCWPVTSSVERRVEKSTQHNLLCCHQPVTEPQTWADRVLPSDNTTWPRCTL